MMQTINKRAGSASSGGKQSLRKISSPSEFRPWLKTRRTPGFFTSDKINSHNA